MPEKARATHSEYGGLFAKYLFVRFELSSEQLKNYRDSLPEGVELNSPGGVNIVTSDLPDDVMKELIEQGTKIRFKHTPALPWWKIDFIENGTYHQQDLENACGYEVFIDNDKSVVYVYWHYS